LTAEDITLPEIAPQNKWTRITTLP
jgi:hypothetical protein